MKKLVLVLFILSAHTSFASEAERLMQEANSLYQKNNYKKAAELYEQILHNGYESESLFYNLGNTYFKLNQLGYAILYYEKAMKLAPGDEDIDYNLKIANARTVDKIEVLPKLFFVKWWESFLSIFSVIGWTYFTYAVFLLLIISIALYFISKVAAYQKWSVFSSLILGTIFLFSTLFLVVRLSSEENYNYGIVVESVVTAKLSPDEQSGDAFIIHEGMKVELEDAVNNWMKIKLPDGKVGWILQVELKKI